MAGIDWTEKLLDWFPMLLLIAVWIIAMWRGKSVHQGKSGKTHGEMLEEHIGEMRRQNDILEVVMKDQEIRLQKLETHLGNPRNA